MEQVEHTAEPAVATAPPAQALAAPVGVPVPAGGPSHVLALLAADPPEVRAARMGQLQRSAGNRSVSRAILARDGEGGAPPSNARPTSLTAPRDELG